MKVGIYARISSDDDAQTKQQGVERQERACRQHAVARGWHVNNIYVDNNVSASSAANVPRPEYDRMLVDLASGKFDRILVLAQDRLLRRPEQLETLFRLHSRLGLSQIECVVGGPIDVTTTAGRTYARVKAVFDQAYSEYIGEKVREQKHDRALRGLPAGGGYRPFGYEKGGLAIHHEEATLVREAVDRVLRGESVRSLCADWNQRGIPTVTGTRWGPNVLGAILQSPRIAGLRTYRREIVACAVWPAIISEAEHLELRMMFDARRRRRGASLARKLLTGLIRCSKCGALMETGWSGPTRTYQCAAGPGKLGCGHTAISAEPVEAYVVKTAFRRIDRLSRGRQLDYSARQSALATLRIARETVAQLAVARFVRHELQDDEYTALRRHLLRDIEAAEVQVAFFPRPSAKFGSTALAHRWPQLTMEDRRSALAGVVASVTILPRTRIRGRVDLSRVDIQFKEFDEAT